MLYLDYSYSQSGSELARSYFKSITKHKNKRNSEPRHCQNNTLPEYKEISYPRVKMPETHINTPLVLFFTTLILNRV